MNTQHWYFRYIRNMDLSIKILFLSEYHIFISASQFNFTYKYIDDVLSINNPDFENYLGQMNHPDLAIKDTTESNASASYFDLHLSIGRDGQHFPLRQA